MILRKQQNKSTGQTSVSLHLVSCLWSTVSCYKSKTTWFYGFILSGKYLLLLPNAILLRVWAVGCVGNVNTTKQQTETPKNVCQNRSNRSNMPESAREVCSDCSTESTREGFAGCLWVDSPRIKKREDNRYVSGHTDVR